MVNLKLMMFSRYLLNSTVSYEKNPCVAFEMIMILTLFLKKYFQIFEMIGQENINLNAKQVDELLDLMSKEEYLENEEKIQKALEKSKEEREQRQQEKLNSKSTETIDDDEKVTLNKADDGKHILDAEKTPTFESTVSHSQIIRLSTKKPN